ncbi:MAG: hypothetical protein COV44_10700 [Deltaproteobacteria bacterium CG11_big_fil_rev_8_21_14_0_20_45_16]|nr:MAG: hypothetical protein COV44_10700 [Deltaproteobacteria bacterium CG11_big_fil_rev_8_21_14_0_20_45_16]
MQQPQSSEQVSFIIQFIRGQLALGQNLTVAKKMLRNQFNETVLEEAVQIFLSQQQHSRSDSQGCILTDPRNFEGWYPGPDLSIGSHWSLLKRKLVRDSGWDEGMIGNLDVASTKVISQIAPPKSEMAAAVKGLVLGYIQSGKTANFSAVIAKAVDSGYKLVVVLSGMHNNLRVQTQARLHDELVGPNEEACNTLTTVDEKGDFSKRQTVSANRALGSSDGFTLVVLKKNTCVLRNFLSWLNNAKPEVLAGCPTLVIDDESDQASINTRKPEDEPSAINEKVRKICEQFKVVSYVGYTATPFANILIDSNEETDLFPRDFIVSLEKPNTYFGPEELFGRADVNASSRMEGMPVVRSIPSHDADIVSASKKKDIENYLNGQLPASLVEAIDSFILAASARAERGQWKKHATMLVHTSRLIDAQEKLKDSVEEHLFELKDQFKRQDSSLLQRLQQLWERDFLKVSKGFKEAKMPSFDVLLKDSERLLDRLEIIVDNSTSEERLSFRDGDIVKAIVIGGNTLSRGLTLEGLTTSYFARSATAYDTLLQMGRWFGYRPGYVDLTRIYVTAELNSKFYHLATVEQEIRDEIKMMAANAERPIDVGVMIRKHPTLKVTNAYKMRTAQLASCSYSGTKLQARYVHYSNERLLSENFHAVEKLIHSCKDSGFKLQEQGFRDFQTCQVYRSVTSELVKQFFERFNFSQANSKFTSKDLVDYIERQVEASELKDWSVALMGTGKGTPVSICGTEFKSSERSVVKESYEMECGDSVQLRALTPPDDELIDLYDCLDTKRNTVEQFLSDHKDENVSQVYFRHTFRPVDRGLLLIYPIEWNPTMTDEEFQKRRAEPAVTEPLRGAGPIFGIAVVFPKSDKPMAGIQYIKNKTV